MRRRNFIKNIGSIAAGASLSVNGLSVRAMARSLMLAPFTCDQVNDRILLLIQLHGGNDGLNTIIPLNQYDTYRNFRPTIGILDNGPRKYLEVDSSLPLKDQIGLHPDLIGIKEMYEDGAVNFIQEVAYTNINGSHFRGKDIWLSGVDGTVEELHAQSGWMGRYLNHRFANYPGDYPSQDMPDPPGLEFGSHIVSLGFHRAEGIPMGLTMSNDPSRFYDDIAGLGGLLPEDIPNSEYGREIRFITEIEKSTNKYAERLAKVFNQGANAPEVTYPEEYHTPTTRNFRNGLSGQLRTVARLISGGCTTKIYLVRMGGFDTHAEQAIAGKPSYGGHGALLYHLSSAIKAFYDDLKVQGLDHRVIAATFSEFGRQVKENGDFGTDHGSTAPMILFGKGLKPGITGTNPNISNIKNNRLIGFQHDYRQVLATLLQDWLGANNGTLQHVEFLEFANQKLDLIESNAIDEAGDPFSYVADTSCDPTPDVAVADPKEDDPDIPTTQLPDISDKVKMTLYPNPVLNKEFTLEVNSDRMTPAVVELYDLQGKRILSQKVRFFQGDQVIKVNINHLQSGIYPMRVYSPGGLIGFEKLSVQ